MSATSHLRDPDSGELIPLPAYRTNYAMTYEASDVPAGNTCPECSEHYPDELVFVYVPQADEWVCHECAAELRCIDA